MPPAARLCDAAQIAPWIIFVRRPGGWSDTGRLNLVQARSRSMSTSRRGGRAAGGLARA